MFEEVMARVTLCPAPTVDVSGFTERTGVLSTFTVAVLTIDPPEPVQVMR
jgi:hypothetical protein